MKNGTEKKILDVALKEFAEKGYKGASVRDIAIKSGFNDSTLYRRFKSKRDLFEAVINRGHEKMHRDFDSILHDSAYETPREFLETFVKDYAQMMEENLETYDLALHDKSGKFEPDMAAFFKQFTEYLEKNLPESKIDHATLAITMAGFMYTLALERYYGGIIPNFEYFIEKFIDNLLMSIE
jgi:AcrR family transcriptional regulator